MSKRVQGGELELFRTDYRGAYTGAFNAVVPDRGVPKVYPSTARAVTPCRLFEIPADDFGRAVWEWFPMAAHLLEGAATQGADASEIVERHERLVALGAVTAGLTHELNNPVAAVMRAAATLRDRLTGMRSDLGRLIRADLDPAPARRDRGTGHPGARAPPRCTRPVTDGGVRPRGRAGRLARGPWGRGQLGARAHVRRRRRGRGVARGTWPTLVPPSHLEAGLTYPVRVLESDGLLDEITEAAGRISGLLASAKQYTQMDRAPLQTFDVHEGLDATLTMLGHKLGDGIEIVRDYDRSLPHIAAYPAELNQVWTNLIDNAVDAMEGHGTLTVRTRPGHDERLVVEVARHRTGRARRGPQPDLRAVLHHQAHGQGHRPRPRHRVAHRRRAPPRRDPPRLGSGRHAVRGHPPPPGAGPAGELSTGIERDQGG